MNILLTNDDGIYAEGIYALYQRLKGIGGVTIVAPDAERSSVGHGITLAQPLRSKKIFHHKKFFGYSINGTPADCVKFAVGVILKQKPDIVVSGINFGTNDGCSVFYSGTVAAAREGALLGIPSMAVSLATFKNPNFSYAARCAAKLVKAVFKYSMPKGTFLNVNVPSCPSHQVKGIKMTKQGIEPIHSSFRKRLDPNFGIYYWMLGRMPTKQKDDRMDTFALEKKYVTVTPVQCDLTNYDYLNQLMRWTL